MMNKGDSDLSQASQSSDPELNLSPLREWSQQINLLSKIPEKAQKGFMTMDLHLTCVGVISDYIALGTNVGLIYWYNRNQDTLERFKFESANMSPFSRISVVSCENYMIAAGTQEGLIAIFQIPRNIPEASEFPFLGPSFGEFQRSKKVQIYTVRDIHRGSITALTWSSNGMKLFSGDASGIVAETEIDFFSGLIKSSKLLEENHGIVQLGYMNQNLLVSSLLRTTIYSNKTKSVTKVGSQDRKTPGEFGAVFAAGLWSKHLKVYTARPGLRLWQADLEGAVQNTLIFKELIMKPHSNVPIINRAPIELQKKNLRLEKQFGVLHNYMGKYLVTWHNNIIYVLDPVNIKVLSVCSQLKSVIAVDVHKDEIFVVETSRNVVRLAPKPEVVLVQHGNSPKAITSSIPSPKPDFKIPDDPLRLLASKIKETSKALPKFNSSALISTMKSVLEADLNIQEGLPNISPQGTPDLEEFFPEQNQEVSPVLQHANSEEIEKFEKISTDSFQEVLLVQFKPEKKSKRKRNNGDPMSDTTSLSSQGSSNSEGLGDSPERDRIFSPSIPNGVKQTQNIIKEEVSPMEVRSKEEMLAKLLNWSELMPSLEDSESKNDRELPGIKISLASPVSEMKIKENNSVSASECEQYHETEEFLNDIANDDNEPSTIVSTFEGNSFGAGKSPQLRNTAEDAMESRSVVNSSNSSSISITTESGTTDYDNLESISENTSSHHNISLGNATDFFGPPSGSSNVTLTEENASTFQDGVMSECPQNSLMTSLLPVQDVKVDGTPLTDNWFQYELPKSVTSISISDKYIISIDAQHSVYYASLAMSEQEHSLRWVKTNLQAIQVAMSPDAAFMWKLDAIGILCALHLPCSANPFHDSCDWKYVCDTGKFVSVESDAALLLKTDNTLHLCRFCSGTGESKCISMFEILRAPATLASIHMLKHDIWGLSVNGKIFYRSVSKGVGSNDETLDCLNGDWNELPLNIISISSISPGSHRSLWIANSQNQIWYVNGIALPATGSYNMWNVSICEDLFPSDIQIQRPSSSLAQWNQKLIEPFRWAHSSSSLTSDAALPLLSSCYTNIAFTIKGTNSVFLNRQSCIGHKWEPMAGTCATLKSWTWRNVYAGSIYNDHGFLWLEEPKGKVFYLERGKYILQPIDMPCTSIASISTSPGALWVLDEEGVVHARCNISASNDLGNGWDRIELLSLPSNRKLVHIACGSEVVWSCDDTGGVYMRNGSLNPPAATDISPAWIAVEGAPYNSDVIFTKVFVGPTDRIVWALDSKGSVYAREAIFPDFLFGIKWLPIPSVEMISLAISEFAVWAVSVNGEIYRRRGISSTNFVGDCWDRIPGSAKVLTVSVCDKAWGLDWNGNLLKHVTEELHLCPEDADDDKYSAEWEMVDFPCLEDTDST